MSVLGLAYACPTCPSTHAFGFSRLTLWQEQRINSFRARSTPPPGLEPGEQISAALRPYDGRIVLVVPDCPPCVADSVSRFVAQLLRHLAAERANDLGAQPDIRFNTPKASHNNKETRK